MSDEKVAAPKPTFTPQMDEKKRHWFFKEIRCMMVGFGDDKNPYTESIELIEELVIDFVTDITLKAMNVGKPGRVTYEDIMYLIRTDSKKSQRVKELMAMNEEIKKAKRAFDEETILKTHGLYSFVKLNS